MGLAALVEVADYVIGLESASTRVSGGAGGRCAPREDLTLDTIAMQVQGQWPLSAPSTSTTSTYFPNTQYRINTLSPTRVLRSGMFVCSERAPMYMHVKRRRQPGKHL